MDMTPRSAFPIVEIRFKNGRKEFFLNSKNLELFAGDPVVVEVASGHHIGYVSLQGEMARMQMRKKGVEQNDEIKSIYRIANEKDLEKFEQARNREVATLYRTREIIQEFKLQMKLSDIEYQADNTKATFYYSADDRVDFRELIKLLASEFKIRIEMKQISLRHEAARLGGIGSCGRELCCSSWLSDFKNVNTSAARYQNLSLNPSKLSGQCGRLKCCLNYELDTYLDALKNIPEIEAPLLTSKGEAHLQKTDIFKRIMWFGYKEETTWHALSVDRVYEIMEFNKKGVKPFSLDLDELDNSPDEDLIKEKAELARFDDKFKKKKKKKKRSGDFSNEGPRNVSSSNPSVNTNTPTVAQPTENRNNRNDRGRNDFAKRENRNPQASKPSFQKPRSGNDNRGITPKPNTGNRPPMNTTNKSESNMDNASNNQSPDNRPPRANIQPPTASKPSEVSDSNKSESNTAKEPRNVVPTNRPPRSNVQQATATKNNETKPPVENPIPLNPERQKRQNFKPNTNNES
jgi:cell fate regulator YaaT (PSP1 superfamily)